MEEKKEKRFLSLRGSRGLGNMNDIDKIKVSGIIKESIVDGPGIRLVVFVQGCPHHCKGCHNPQTHDFDGGKDILIKDIVDEINKNPLLSGVTFSGGEPFCQAKQLTELAKEVHKYGLNIITYTGYEFEYLIGHFNDKNSWYELLENIDILIDGPFMLEERSLDLKFRGSKNQRVIDVKKSLLFKQAVTMEL